jgi:catechol 2,3-dioxygenase-like lactoylglutathione lyase family enzyme
VYRFKNVVPVLLVADMQRSVDWYTGVLGFEPGWRSPADGGGENGMLHTGEVDLLLSTGPHLGGEPKFTGTLYFHMDGEEAFYERVKDRVDVIWPLEVMDYGTLEFGVRDPDGYSLAFSEEARQ